MPSLRRNARHGVLALLLALWFLPTALASGAHGTDADHHNAGMSSGSDIAEPADVHYTLRTSFSAGAIGFIGVGGDIDGVLNPKLSATEGSIVEITIINGDGIEHDISFPEFGAMSEHVFAINETASVKFHATHTGTFEYDCAAAGHRAAGMHGQFVVAHAPDAEHNHD